MLQKWIELTNQPLRRFGQDFAPWKEMADFVSRPDPIWAEANLKQNLASYEIHALWVLDASGRLVYSAQANPGPALPPPPSGEPATGEGFFTESRDGILQVWRWPVASSPEATPLGWLVLARLWGAGHLTTLSRLSDAELLLAPPDQPAGIAENRQEIRLPLRTVQGRPLRHLVMRLTPPDFSEALARDTLAAYLFIAFGLLVILALWLAVRQWVLLPLDRIGESLAQNDPAFIRPLLQDRTELGRVAQLVESSFRQKAELGREIDDHRHTESALRDSEARLRHALELRARLARDLHDGVIQSIYAAGLGLEGAMAQLHNDPTGARTRLQLCRQSLNEVIREVRGFISGIDPEALHHQGFDQELGSLVRTMQALWPVRIQVQTDPAIISRLVPSQELHAIQICRECVSNAVRHGGARKIDISLTPVASGAALRVADQGGGFDPATARGSGSGLGNLAARARELGGRLDLESHPGAGATVTVTFPLAPVAS